MEILLNISEISIITGDNIYKSKREYLIEFWKKNNIDDYEKYIKLTNFIKETDEDIIKNITLNNNMNISVDLDNCIKSTNVNDLNLIKNNILSKIDNLTEPDKKKFTESIKNIANTKFGINNENDVTKIYENITGNIIVKDDKYRKLNIFKTDNINIYIGGRIDGINTKDGTIIEIKNRIHKLFYNLRNYEKVQIMCYMYLFNTKKSHLVEAHKKKEMTDINIIEVNFDDIYMNNIIHKILLFSKYYCNFISNHDLKITLLTKNKDIDFI